MNRDTQFIQTLQSKIRVISGEFQPNGTNNPIPLKKNGVKSIIRFYPGSYLLTFDDMYNRQLVSGQVGIQLNTPGPLEAGFSAVGIFGDNQLIIGVSDITGAAAKEVTDITCPADTGSLSTAAITVSGGATLNNGDFFTVFFPDGDVYAFYYIIDGVLPVLSGPVIAGVPPSNQIPITITSTMTAPVVADFTAAILNSFLSPDAIAFSLLATVTIVQTKMGPTSPSAGYDAASNPVIRISAINTSGTISNLNNTYWLLNSALDNNRYYVWYNVDNEGIDPSPPGLIPIPVSVIVSDSATNVATATAAAIALVFGDFSPVTSALNVVTVTNTQDGPTTDASAGTTTGFTFLVTTQGDLMQKDLSFNANNIISYSFYFNDTDTGW